MGCGWSKSGDSDKNRERAPVAAPAGAAASGAKGPARSGAVGIGGAAGPGAAAAAAAASGGVYGKSWTEEHMKEQDFLKKLVERTQLNFIDVMQEPTLLDEKDVEERINRYTKHKRTIDSASSADPVPGPLRLPKSTIPDSALADLLKQPRISEGLRFNISQSCRTISSKFAESTAIVPLDIDLVVSVERF